ncbi:MAG: ACP S-malonyltransferase [Planctomycetota bacterium]
MSATALLFPGQGAQKVGMGGDFVARHAAARELFARADEVLGRDLSRVCLEGPEDELTLTRNCQPGIYLTGAAIVAVMEAEGKLDRDRIAATAGLSLGEYTALWYAGAFDFEDGLRLVERRGAYMQDASDDPPSGMVSLLGADLAQAEAVADAAAQGEVLSVANLLSPGQIVLSGTLAAVERAVGVAKEMGIRRAIPLKVAGAFHSALMEPAARRLAADLAEIDIRDPRIPVAGNVGGELMRDAATIRRCLEAQVTSPVQWEGAMRALVAAGIGHVLEPGPGKVLTGLMKKIAPEVTSGNVDVVADLEAL